MRLNMKITLFPKWKVMENTLLPPQIVWGFGWNEKLFEKLQFPFTWHSNQTENLKEKKNLLWVFSNLDLTSNKDLNFAEYNFQERIQRTFELLKK